MSSVAPRTFRDLFAVGDFRGVEIPIIQRDYAQGRNTASDIRNQFIDALYDALTLPPDSPRLPLDLDFVYGSMDQSDLGTVFSPLDGQQRLTALFLLHWYLAVHDGELVHFQQYMCRDGRQSRFSYKIRASADEFFDTLANAQSTLPAPRDGDTERKDVVTRAIEDQPWFFLAWRQDPTVASALQVLDTIHERFKDTDSLYDRLVDQDSPPITFQFLNLRDFGLSDELYIKMNARGKALTEFEAFKARLQQKIDTLLHGQTYAYEGHQVSPKEYFGHRVDTAWAELFWHHREEGSRTFDREFMNFVRGLVTVTFPYAMRDTDPVRVNTTMRTLYKHSEHYDYYRYNREVCLTPDFAEILISVLDQVSSNGQDLQRFLPNADYYDEQDVFARILRREPPERPGGVSYSEWVQFYGYCTYLHKRRPTPGDEYFAEWMRLVSNLALHTIINRADDFIRALVGVRELLERIGDGSPLAYVADPANAQSVLNQQQWREEKLKAQLMNRDPRWGAVIAEAETHRYFRGQIEFLLDFAGILQRWLDDGGCSWDDDEDEAYRGALSTQYAKANAIFDGKGLRQFESFAWERTLLSFGDYLLPNGRNMSLLDNRDRDASWKRLLRGSEKADDPLAQKRELVRSALAVVDPADPQGALERRIEEYLATPEADGGGRWRRLLVECPDALAYCRKRFLRDTGQNGWFLLKSLRTSAYHAELRTFHASHVLLPAMRERGKLEAFSAVEYEPVCYEGSLPRAVLTATPPGIKASIRFQSNRYQLCVELAEGCADDMLDAICERLPFFRCKETDGLAGRCIALDDLGAALQSLSEAICAVSSGDTP